jgi:glycine cleavage system regulatory protein
MPKSDELDKAGDLLVKAAQDLKTAMDRYGPEQGKRMTSPEAVYATVQDLAGQVSQAAAAFAKVGTQLRTAAAELESADET